MNSPPLPPPKIRTTLEDSSTNNSNLNQAAPTSSSSQDQSQEADTSLKVPPSPSKPSSPRDRSVSPIGTRITPVRSNSTSSRFHEHISSGESEGETENKDKEGASSTGHHQGDFVEKPHQPESPTAKKSIGLAGLTRALSSKSKSGKPSRPAPVTRSETAQTNFSAVTAMESPIADPETENGNQVRSDPTIVDANDLHHGQSSEIAKGKDLPTPPKRNSDSSWERIEVPSYEEMSKIPNYDSQSSRKGRKAAKSISKSKSKSKSQSVASPSKQAEETEHPNLNAGILERGIDPLKEPRRNIKKRPIEFKTGQAIGGPILRSGVVLDGPPPTLRDWIPSPAGLNSLQGAYLLIAHCFGAAIISGAINFGIGVATYINQPAVHIWIFNPITLAGDMGLTVVLQQMITMLITSSMVHKDLQDGPIIGSFRKPWPPLLHLPSTPSPNGNFFGFKTSSEVSELNLSPLKMGKAENLTSNVKIWFYFILRSVFTGSEKNDILASGISARKRVERILWTAAQGLVLSAFTFWWYWPISIAIVAPLYEHREHILVHSFIAPIVKLIYGAVLAILTNPIFAMMAMGSEFQVRRCYPELEMWKEFGGDEDTREWRKEMGLQDQDEIKEVEQA